MTERSPRNHFHDRQRNDEIRKALESLGKGRLILTRKVDQGIVIAPGILISVLSIDGDRVKLGIKAPDDTLILRAELLNTDDPQIDSHS